MQQPTMFKTYQTQHRIPTEHATVLKLDLKNEVFELKQTYSSQSLGGARVCMWLILVEPSQVVQLHEEAKKELNNLLVKAKVKEM